LKFLDWDELYQVDDINILLDEIDLQNKDPKVDEIDCSMVHKYLDGGFERTTLIALENGCKKKSMRLTSGMCCKMDPK
jgi:hypothetical protein